MRFHFRQLLPLALMSMGCGADSSCPGMSAMTLQPGPSSQAMSAMLTSYAGCLVDSDEVRVVGEVQREQVKDDVYHYSVRLQVGPDAAHDLIGLHRVVRERSAWVPAQSANALFLVHGDAWNFQGAFMAGTLTGAVPKEQSFAVYMAQKGVDVWGIDQRWTRVPLETTDFSFMKDWNMGTHAKDVGTGLSVARQVRAHTGGGNGQLKLLGWSRGAQVAYAYMSAETRLPASERHVSGLIPVDMVLKFGPEAAAQKQAACVRAQAGEYALSQNRYEGTLGGPGAGLALLAVAQGAIASPGTPAQPPLPQLPYGQLGVALGAATYSLIADPAHGIEAPVPFYHFAAGKFVNNQLAGLQYVSEPQFFGFLSTVRPYQDLREQVEGDQLMCDALNLPYDDYLKDVKVPVLYVGAGGGFGKYGEYTVKSVLGSKDVTVQRVSFKSDAERFADFGHTDLWLGNNAAKSVWEPIYNWVLKH